MARILEAELDDLTENGRLSVTPPAAVRSWDIPAEAKEELLSHGLPQAIPLDKYLGVGAAFQEGELPEYVSDKGRCYVIAVCGDVRVVARERSGQVLAVPEHREMIPQLAHLHPGGVPDEVINSSVTVLVDFAWRWHWLSRVLTEQEEAADEAESAAWRAARESGSKDPLPDFHELYRMLCQVVRERFREIDPVSIQAERSMWSEMINGFE
ncbi:SUKH-4 family immunity protein [Streptomyces sp. NPDC057565]|uniref:SUKH-4 family immunity protein n=1 Tax=Streptomyces sp. NPDC057565 TaxID=3346169 RepID=UPI0036A2EDDB